MTGKMKSTGIDKTTNMNWYIYWYYVNVYFFRILIGWMRRGMGRGLAFYMLLSFSPLYALYALPVMVAERYFGMTTVYNQYIFWVLIFGVPSFISPSSTPVANGMQSGKRIQENVYGRKEPCWLSCFHCAVSWRQAYSCLSTMFNYEIEKNEYE